LNILIGFFKIIGIIILLYPLPAQQISQRKITDELTFSYSKILINYALLLIKFFIITDWMNEQCNDGFEFMYRVVVTVLKGGNIDGCQK